MKNKIIALIALLLLPAMTFCSCSSVKEIKSTDEEAKVVGSCGDHDIRYEELRYLTMGFKAELQSKYGEYIFDSADTGAQYEERLWEMVAEALIENYSLVDACAERGIKTNSKTTKKEVKEYVKESVDACGDFDAYKAYLADNYMTDWVFRLNTAILSCQGQYYDLLSEELHKESYDAVMAGEGIIRCMSIFVKNDPGESAEENRKIAQDVRDQVASGKALLESFIGKSCNQDTSNCDYYFMRGYFVEEYENAAFDLEIGEVSEVVEVSDGFYVIQRMETDPSYISNHVENLQIQYYLSIMEEETNRIAESLSVQFNEYGKSIVLWSMK